MNILRMQSLFPADTINDAPSNGIQPLDSTVNPTINPAVDPVEKLKQIFTPDTAKSDALDQLINQYPTHDKIGIGHRIIAGLAGLKDPQLAESFLNAPFESKLADWKNKLNPAISAAQLEQKNNNDKRLLFSSEEADQLNQRKLDETIKKDTSTQETNQRKLDIASRRADIYAMKADRPELKYFTDKDGKVMAYDPIAKKASDTGILSGDLNDADKLRLQLGNSLAEIQARGNVTQANIAATGDQNRQTANETRGWTVFNVPDGKGGQKAIRLNQITGEVQDLPTGPVDKPNSGNGAAKVTAQTQAIMDAANFMLPHVKDLREQAADLDRRGLFGPVMSRVTALAGKIGTTGNIDKDVSNLNDVNNELTKNSGVYNQSNDAAVGAFLTNLGLMASGTGRAHGGARGGGSIQMINYLKGLLSANSTLSMFNGRINELEKYLKGYAAGPKAISKTKLDTIIENIMGGQ